MSNNAWTDEYMSNAIRNHSLLSGLVVVFLLAGALSIAAGTAFGLLNFTDVAYPDSATLLRIGEVVRSGHIYPDIDQPPYLATLYGPLTYVLLGIPYSLAQTVGINPQLPVRIGIAGALCICVLFVFLISRRLYDSRPIAWLCALFALSALPLADWSIQIRGDFLALGFSLFSVYLFIQPNGRSRVVGAAICAGLALLVKQTFFAAPIAIVSWLIYSRRYREAVFWTAGFVLTVVGGYSLVLWREPLMLKHLAALRHPVFEFKQAIDILWNALSQPVVPFAAIGGVLALRNCIPERILFLIYCLVAWGVAMLTIWQVGGNINYFWEPLLTSAVLAGQGLCELQRRANRTPVLVTAMLFLLILQLFSPMLMNNLRYLKQTYRKFDGYHMKKARWESFLSIISGQRLLSTIPALTLRSTTPEIPDPYLNSVLELRGRWNPAPVVVRIDAGVYDVIVIGVGHADEVGGHRGIRFWNNAMWGAMKKSYKLACVFDEKEVWLPHRGNSDIFSKLSAIGCLPFTEKGYVSPMIGSQSPLK
jgi:hypothetical protein